MANDREHDAFRRELLKREPTPKNKGGVFERGLLNLTRKIRNHEKLAVYILAESLASDRIRARLAARRNRHAKT